MAHPTNKHERTRREMQKRKKAKQHIDYSKYRYAGDFVYTDSCLRSYKNIPREQLHDWYYAQGIFANEKYYIRTRKNGHFRKYHKTYANRYFRRCCKESANGCAYKKNYCIMF